jgi:membrane protein CcdC involved in cytochrome C biogenesis
VPEDIDIIDVQGEGIREWTTEKAKDRVKVTVAASYEVTGDFSLVVLYEKNMGDTTAEVSVPQIEVLDVVREKGFLAVTAATRVGVEEVSLENLAMLDVTELPGGLVNASDTPIFYSYKYIKHPYSLVLAVSTFEDVEVIDANVSRAELDSLLTRRGDFVTRAVFTVANNARQFMKLSLPGNTTIWSTYVSGRPVKPAVDEDGTILIPLDRSERSGYGNGGLSTFEVEVIYYTETKDLSSILGQRGFIAPLVNMKVDELVWSLYLPENYVYKNTGDDMDYFGGPGPKPIREDKEFGMVGGGAMRSMEDAPSIYIEEGMDMDYYVEEEWPADESMMNAPESQVYMEKNVYTEGLESLGGETGRGMKGVLPVRFDIPFTGHGMSYRKVIVNPEDVSTIKLRYQSRDLIHWVEVLEVIAWAVVFGVIIVGIRSAVRKRKLYLNKDKTIALASAVAVIVLLHIVFILRGGLPGWGVFWGLVGGFAFLARDLVVAARRSIALHRERKEEQHKEVAAKESTKAKKGDDKGE